MARPVAVDPHDRRRSPSQRRTSPSHQLRRTPGEKQRPPCYKPPGQTVNTADSARTVSGALIPDELVEILTGCLMPGDAGLQAGQRDLGAAAEVAEHMGNIPLRGSRLSGQVFLVKSADPGC